MGRPKAEFVNLDIERRRNYALNRYYKTKEELVNNQAKAHAFRINLKLGLDLTAEQLEQLADYLKEHCKFKIK